MFKIGDIVFISRKNPYKSNSCVESWISTIDDIMLHDDKKFMKNSPQTLNFWNEEKDLIVLNNLIQ